MFLKTPIDNLPRTSKKTIKRFQTIGIKTYWDLINYFPFRYQDYRLTSTIDRVQEGETVSVKGEIIDLSNRITKRGMKIQKILLYDKTGKIELIWYNQPFLLNILKPGQIISVAGRVKRFLYSLVIEPEEYELLENLEEETIHTGRLVPIYPEKKGLSSRVIREKVHLILNKNQEWIEILPEEILSYNSLIKESEAYRNIHFPQDKKTAQAARKRLAFDELFIIQLSARLVKEQWQKERVGKPFKLTSDIKKSLLKLVKNLSFELTSAQKRCLSEILSDLSKDRPMNRFLQGDVGAGKTVVGTIAAYLAYLNQYQTLFMAPTEILAQQHYQTITKIFSQSNISPCPKIALLTGSVKPKKDDLKTTDLIVGTHALIQTKIKFNRVGLVIIDEQQRFGVVQRAMLKEKGINPHLLTMTATPIPRTVALTLYGELDLSYIDELPKGRKKVKTFLVPKYKRDHCYKWIKEQILKNQSQVFIICPLIEESDKDSLRSVKAVKKEYQYLKTAVFSDFKIGLLHGRLKSEEKNRIMKEFKNKKYQILVSTSVIEVGIDIPDASIMIIEGAERYGLSQLHQLRGRVGRGKKQSYCFLFTEKQSEKILKRLNYFVKTNAGIKLAEYDLRLRGPGEIYGLKQHGFINLKIASLTDQYLINKAKTAVNFFKKRYSLNQFSQLKERIKEYQIGQITRD